MAAAARPWLFWLAAALPVGIAVGAGGGAKGTGLATSKADGTSALMTAIGQKIAKVEDTFDEPAHRNTTSSAMFEFDFFRGGKGRGSYCDPDAEPGGVNSTAQKQVWCSQSCVKCWQRDHAEQWLEHGTDEHLAQVHLVRALERKAEAVRHVEARMLALRNESSAMELSVDELEARLEGKTLRVQIMNELENVATFALREIDSMAREASHRDAAAAGENGGEGVLMLMTKLKDVLQAVQYSVMIAEKARVALTSNAKSLGKMEVIPCEGAWGDWSACTAIVPATNAIEQQGRGRGSGDLATAAGHANPPSRDTSRSSECSNASRPGLMQRQYTVFSAAQHGGVECAADHNELELANCTADPLPCSSYSAAAVGQLLPGASEPASSMAATDAATDSGDSFATATTTVTTELTDDASDAVQDLCGDSCAELVSRKGRNICKAAWAQGCPDDAPPEGFSSKSICTPEQW